MHVQQKLHIRHHTVRAMVNHDLRRLLLRQLDPNILHQLTQLLAVHRVAVVRIRRSVCNACQDTILGVINCKHHVTKFRKIYRSILVLVEHLHQGLDFR